MIPQKVKDHIEEYISQEVYVQIAIIKGKEKVSTETAIDKYFNTNHFKDFSEGKPYFHFIDGLRDKCLGKLKDSPMRDKATEDETIKLLQKKLNDLTDDDTNLIGKLFQVAKEMAKKLNIDESGYRTIFNCNNDGGQTVYHIHLHLIGVLEFQ